MNQQQKNEALARWLGWTPTGILGMWDSREPCESVRAEFFEDLNQCAEIEAKMALEELAAYALRVAEMMGFSGGSPERPMGLLRQSEIMVLGLRAPAAARAEALGLTLGLWKAES